MLQSPLMVTYGKNIFKLLLGIIQNHFSFSLEAYAVLLEDICSLLKGCFNRQSGRSVELMPVSSAAAALPGCGGKCGYGLEFMADSVVIKLFRSVVLI